MGEAEAAGFWREKGLESGKGRNFLFGERESGEKEWKCVEISEEEAAIWFFFFFFLDGCPERIARFDSGDIYIQAKII